MFYKKVSDLCNQNGIAMTTLAVNLGLSKSVVTNWKKTDATPRPSTVKKIADYFGVGVDYFSDENSVNVVNGANAPVAITSGHHNTVTLSNGETHTRELSEIETELLKVCEKLDTRKKALLLAKAYEILESQEVDK